MKTGNKPTFPLSELIKLSKEMQKLRIAPINGRYYVWLPSGMTARQAAGCCASLESYDVERQKADIWGTPWTAKEYFFGRAKLQGRDFLFY